MLSIFQFGFTQVDLDLLTKMIQNHKASEHFSMNSIELFFPYFVFVFLFLSQYQSEVQARSIL